MNKIWEENKKNCDEANRLKEVYRIDELSWFHPDNEFGVSIANGDSRVMSYGPTMETAVQNALTKLGNVEVKTEIKKEIVVDGLWQRFKRWMGLNHVNNGGID
jgi:hypothetical protein